MAYWDNNRSRTFERDEDYDNDFPNRADERNDDRYDKRTYGARERYDQENRRGPNFNQERAYQEQRDPRFARYGRDENYRDQSRSAEGREYYNDANRAAYANGYGYRQSDSSGWPARRDDRSPNYGAGSSHYPDENPRHDFAGQHSYFPNHFGNQHYPERPTHPFEGMSDYFTTQRYERHGRHSGKGPKNYHRSDERLKEEINERLTQDGHLDASDIAVDVTNGVVTLSGTVDSKHAKRHAEDIADDVHGVKEVINQIRHSHQSNSGSSSSGSNNFGRGDGSVGMIAH